MVTLRDKTDRRCDDQQIPVSRANQFGVPDLGQFANGYLEGFYQSNKHAQRDVFTLQMARVCACLRQRVEGRTQHLNQEDSKRWDEVARPFPSEI